MRNVAMGAMRNIEVRAYGLAELPGRGHLVELSGSNVGGSRLVDDIGDGVVELVRLDDEIDGVVNFIKLDVEGSELSALKGATKLLVNHRPVVFSEVLDVSAGVDLLRYMQGLGYFCCGINTPAFNPANHNGSTNDIFADGRECGLLFLPTESAARFSERIDTLELPLVETPDDIVLLLMQQPQYNRDTLRRQISARKLKVPPALCDILRTEARCGELEEATKRAETESLEFREAATRAEAKALEHQEATQKAVAAAMGSREAAEHARVEFGRYSRMAQAHLDELSKLQEHWSIQHSAALRLARRVQKFPFSLYFKLNKRHRHATRSLLQSAEVPNLVRGQMTELKNTLSEPLPTSATKTSNAHVAVLRSISSQVEQNVLSPMPEINEPVLEADAIKVALGQGSDDVVVSISHDNYLNVTGGTQICIQIEASRAVAAGMAYLNVHPVRTCTALLPESEIDTAVFRLTLNGSVIGLARYAVMIAAIEELTALQKNVQFVVHHLLGHAPEAVARLIQASKKESCCFWLHDYFAACRSYTLMRNTLQYCGAPDVKSSACEICVFGASRSQHMERFRDFFDRIAVTLLAPSQVAADVWSKSCNYKLQEIVVQPHITIEPVDRQKLLPSFDSSDAAPIRVAFVGAPVAHKGWLEFEQLVADHLGSTAIEFHYFGCYDVEPQIVKHHVVVSSEVPDAMTRALAAASIDFVVHFARWPETFSLTAAEALGSHAFVLTNEGSGNVAALVQTTGRGKVLASSDALSVWLRSPECRDLALRVRQQRRVETLHARYSDMALTTLQRMTAQ